jgi:hypothetical protein
VRSHMELVLHIFSVYYSSLLRMDSYIILIYIEIGTLIVCYSMFM